MTNAYGLSLASQLRCWKPFRLCPRRHWHACRRSDLDGRILPTHTSGLPSARANALNLRGLLTRFFTRKQPVPNRFSAVIYRPFQIGLNCPMLSVVKVSAHLGHSAASDCGHSPGCPKRSFGRMNCSKRFNQKRTFAPACLERILRNLN